MQHCPGSFLYHFPKTSIPSSALPAALALLSCPAPPSARTWQSNTWRLTSRFFLIRSSPALPRRAHASNPHQQKSRRAVTRIQYQAFPEDPFCICGSANRVCGARFGASVRFYFLTTGWPTYSDKFRLSVSADMCVCPPNEGLVKRRLVQAT